MSKFSNLIYMKVAEQVEIYIAQHRLKPNDKLPSERELAELWNISRMTVRSAVEKLVDDGVLYSIRGSGTFVASKKVVLNLGVASSFTDMVRGQNFSLETKVLSIGKTEANKELAKVFSVSLGTEIVELVRKRIVDAIPFSIETSYIPNQLFLGIDQFDFTKNSLFNLLQVNYHIQITNQKHYIYSAPLSVEDSKELDQAVGSTCLLLNSHALASDGRTVVFTKEWVRPDRCIIKSVSREEE